MEKRKVQFDSELGIEAYHFEGIMQKFPNHFHEHYVIGFVESGRRFLICKNLEYTIEAGDLVLFNPMESHTCKQIDDQPLDWRCLNINTEVMKRITAEITRTEQAPTFTTTVASNSKVLHCRDAVSLLRDLHNSIMEQNKDFDKEETFYFLIEQLIADYTQPFTEYPSQKIGKKILSVCDYIEKNYAETMSLSELSEVSHLNKYTLIRNFTLQKGITPYQYLSTIRINKAKELLESGVAPIDAAFQSGFTDQSHFTRFFKNFIGLTPGRYQSLLNTKHDGE
jgi:AraC-like DNA-binding protein/mannose-6-phosphate isomerase-like protein (cupin superfamily)